MERKKIERIPYGWLNTEKTLNTLRALTDKKITSQELMNLCLIELCMAYIDCSFATGAYLQDNFLTRKIRGYGYCALLEPDKLKLSSPNNGNQPRLLVNGQAMVRGTACAYSISSSNLTLEDGIWQLDLGHTPRQAYFKISDIHKLASILSQTHLIPPGNSLLRLRNNDPHNTI